MGGGGGGLSGGRGVRASVRASVPVSVRASDAYLHALLSLQTRQASAVYPILCARVDSLR